MGGLSGLYSWVCSHFASILGHCVRTPTLPLSYLSRMVDL